MSTGSSHAGSTISQRLRSIATALHRWSTPIVGAPALKEESSIACGFRDAIAEANSLAARLKAIDQAQKAGVPLHEIEQLLDWSDAANKANV